ncbi:hypothetical protein [Paenibacillus sp. MMS18-CY102]|uniref:hypothetical protein n=1 Tax=Paenibacillus sp. MMS18-CY102 TaxID=2682849 RepID=UPI0013662104|nr:hypothetical protein [Paenibacillus sp. MMS18-CY102]MWC30026.1 hypothetical protein [Paenibacillus sp. MMS18-CY102]
MKNTFDLNITENKPFSEMQFAAKEGMLLSIDAIKSGNMTKLNGFIDALYAGDN